MMGILGDCRRKPLKNNSLTQGEGMPPGDPEIGTVTGTGQPQIFCNF